MQPKPNALVIKFGGSNAITEQGANKEYLRKFLKNLLDELPQYEKLAFVIGGGVRCRILQEAVDDAEEKDRVGIQSTWEHADGLREVLEELGLEPAKDHPQSVDEAREMLEKESILTMGGLQIGQSTDAVSAYAAHRFAVQGYHPALVILSNVTEIYDSDPRKNDSAKPIQESSVEQLVQEQVLLDDPNAWVPGMSITIDPVAVTLLMGEDKKQVIPLYFGHGDDWQSVLAFLNDEPLVSGTRLLPGNEATIYWDK